VGNLGAAVKLIATLIEQSGWIFSYSDEAEEEVAVQEEEEGQPLESFDQPEGEPEIFHEAETSFYETAPQEPGGEDTRTADASSLKIGTVRHTGDTTLTA
jgi:hypothetical protein